MERVKGRASVTEEVFVYVTFPKDQQSTYDTTFKFTDPIFYFDLHKIAHTHKYQSPKNFH